MKPLKPLGIRVTLVEDSPDDLLLANEAILMLRLPWTLSVAGSVDLAIQMLSRSGDRPPHLIITALLQEFAGFNLIRWIRTTPGLTRVPVVVLSGVIDPAILSQALHLGADRVVHKACDLLSPFREIADFLASINQPRSLQVCG